MERTGEAILPGTGHLSISAEAAATYAGRLQLGYVVDGNSAKHAGGVNKSITWLEPVPHGGNRSYEVAVPANQTEAPDHPTRWDFYYRLQPPAMEQDCYTGAGAGEIRIQIDAVRAESGG